ncbi:MAG TPA: DUF922 domain-containing protein [Candidatus Saccharimonadales bacterium]|nr:DUF922 domain-containing protein [Candidatus Saccharimonadales bacterium]
MAAADSYVPPAVIVARANHTVSAGSETKPAPVTVQPAHAVPVPACTPVTVAMPGAVALQTGTRGVQIVADPVYYYKVYGTTVHQAAAETAACAPLAQGTREYTGYTAYTLNWRYTFTPTAGGSCAIGDAAVGLHIQTVVPDWADAQTAAVADQAAWRQFAQNLMNHEQGHGSLDRHFADELYAKLQTLSATDCATLSTQAASIARQYVADVAAANTNYDQMTDHGATQGAILP